MTLILGISGVRGIVDDGLDEGVAYRLASAFAELLEPGSIVLGRDSRPSGPRICRAVTAALADAGRAIVDLGVVTTPTVQVATEFGAASGGIVVTASHNPREWNALKFIGADGTFLGPAVMERLIASFHVKPDAPFPRIQAESGCDAVETSAGRQAVSLHVARILAAIDAPAIRDRSLRVVIDGVHGAGFVLLSPLLDALNVSAVWIDGEPNGDLPDHPEPRAERLAPLVEHVAREHADLGFALDPDGDRCAVVLPDRVLGEEWTLPLCALARLSRGERGPLVTNLSSSSLIEVVAARYGATVERTPVGEAHVVGRAREIGALLAGEGNGGVIDPAVHWGRDAGVAVAHLLGLEARGDLGGLRAVAAALPARTMRKQALALDRARFVDLGRALRADFGPPADERDGLRWTWPDGWLHVRPSNTEPIVRIIAEGASESEAEARIDRALAAAKRMVSEQSEQRSISNAEAG